ncbi:MAG: hypothetical protein AAF360_11340 [Pseudomonadota bacterium]
MTEDLRGFERSLPIALLRARESTKRLFKPHVDAASLTLPQWRVIRALAEGDGRRLTLRLTEKGAVIFEQIAPVSELIYQDLEDRFGADRLASLLSELRALREVADNLSVTNVKPPSN